MARSSGGGSRSGGSHSSSRSSSSSRSHGSSGRSIRRTNHYFPGARKFRYYKGGAAHYVYSNVDLTRQKDVKPRWFMIFFYFPFLAAIFGMWSSIFKAPAEPLSTLEISEVCIMDEMNILTEEDEDELLDKMIEFSETTGVTTKVLTLPYEEWVDNGSLENYTLSRYYAEFDDENGWLLTYSMDTKYTQEWYWEGIQGDNTFDILDVFIDEFNTHVQSHLVVDKALNPAKAFASGLEIAIREFESQTFGIEFEGFATALFFTSFICLHAALMIFGGTRKGYSYKELEEIYDDETMGSRSNVKTVFDDIDEKPERICPYCGIVLEDDEKKCLNCGAIVP